MSVSRPITAFQNGRCLAAGEASAVLTTVKETIDKGAPDDLLFFDDESGEQLDFNLHGTIENVLEGLARHPFFVSDLQKKPLWGKVGRPKLGVVSREVTLLPRHWSWLENQPNGASAALRRLVEKEMKKKPEAELKRQRIEAAGRVMWNLAGELPGFEEASRFLYRGELDRLESLMETWPEDVRNYLLRLTGQP